MTFSDDGSRILASRAVVQATAMHHPDDDRQLMEDLRMLAQESSLNVTVFHHQFVFFDQVSCITPQSTVFSMIYKTVMNNNAFRADLIHNLKTKIL